jgi:uncharacterized protein (TIGR02246 family)
MRLTGRVVAAALPLAIAACMSRKEPAPEQAGQPMDPAAAASEIRTRSQELVAAETRKDVETAMRYWGDSAVVHVEGAPAARGHSAIRKVYGEFFSAPMTFDSSSIGEIRVARSGELAYETGVNHFTYIAGKKKTPATGKYLVIWGRRADGSWVVESLAATNDKAATP